jgi:molecular chaperone DnaK (HSP70)
MRTHRNVLVVLVALVLGLGGLGTCIPALKKVRRAAEQQASHWPAGTVVQRASGILDARGVMTEALGMETIGGAFTPIIEAGARAPCAKTQSFSTAADNQTSITISLYRGSKKLATENTLVGHAVLSDLRLAARGEPMIAVTFAVNLQGDVLVSALDEATGRPVKVLLASTTMDEAF